MTSNTDEIEDDYEDFDGFDDGDKRGVSGLTVLLIILGMLLAFSFIVSMAYSKGVRQGALQEAPRIAADPEPVKSIAANDSTTNGGTVETREVYDRFDGNTNTRSEVLGSAPEEPLITNTGSDSIGELAAAAQNEVSQTVTNTRDNVEESVESVAAQAQNVTNSVRDNTQIASETVTQTLSENDPLASVIRDAVNDSDVSRGSNGVIGVTPASDVSNSVAAIGTHVVQVAAFRSQEEADNFWRRLNDRFGSYLSDKSKDIEVADLGSKGTYYRLRIAGFNSREEATTYCSGLKARSQDCLVISR